MTNANGMENTLFVCAHIVYTVLVQMTRNYILIAAAAKKVWFEGGDDDVIIDDNRGRVHGGMFNEVMREECCYHGNTPFQRNLPDIQRRWFCAERGKGRRMSGRSGENSHERTQGYVSHM